MPGEAAYKGRSIRWFAQEMADGTRRPGFEVEMGDGRAAQPVVRHVDIGRFAWGLKRQGVKVPGRRLPAGRGPERATQDAA